MVRGRNSSRSWLEMTAWGSASSSASSRPTGDESGWRAPRVLAAGSALPRPNRPPDRCPTFWPSDRRRHRATRVSVGRGGVDRCRTTCQAYSLSQGHTMSNLFVEAMRGRQAYGRRSGVGELYNLRAINRSDLRRCRHVELHRGKNGLDHRRRMGGPDPRGDNPVHIGRDGNRRQAGSQPADNHDDAADHGGNIRGRHRRGNCHRVVAEPPAGCQRERVKW